MKTRTILLGICAFISITAFGQKADKNGWISLWDGETLDGWKASENPASFSVENGSIKVDGPRAHLFYVGDIEGSDFTNFEFKAKVKTAPSANSGIFFHTAYQEEGWPSKGYEVQVNQSHSDWRKTGSLYSYDDVREVHVDDNEWYTQHFIVKGDSITVKINGKTVVEYVESKDQKRSSDKGEQKFDSGTFAIQAHDPESVVYFKDIQVKPLP
ncbi:3-keto-disaccharide hydrolase [Parapedobacter sp. DT-150]|uniref:3-keto-disaccharide hydrolase n=1 Tax=Parapedobacter sp. DT-150 TaxID=3396162 RepID=UPI003F1A50B6